MPRFSKKKLLYLIQDESKSARMYRKAGYPGIARDELRHRATLVRQLRKKRG